MSTNSKFTETLLRLILTKVPKNNKARKKLLKKLKYWVAGFEKEEYKQYSEDLLNITKTITDKIKDN